MPPLLAVPNVSEGRDAERARRAARRAFTRGAAPARPPHRRRPRPHRLHPRRRAPAALTEALVAGAEEALETIDMARLPRRPPGDRRPRRLPAGLARPRRPRRRPHRGGRRRRRRSAASASRSSSTASWRASPGRAERAYFRNGGLAELWLRMEAGELRPDFGPRAAAPRAPAPPWSPRGRRSPPSTSSSTAATSRSPARSPPACARPGGGLPGVRAIGLLLSSGRGPGLDQRPRPAGGAAGRRSSSGCGSWRRRSAPARSRPSWSA